MKYYIVNRYIYERMAASEVPLGELRTQNGITDDGYDHHSLHGTPCFEVTEKNNDLLNGILKDILQRIREHDETLKPWKYLFRS